MKNTEQLDLINVQNAAICPSYFQNWINRIAYHIHYQLCQPFEQNPKCFFHYNVVTIQICNKDKVLCNNKTSGYGLIFFRSKSPII